MIIATATATVIAIVRTYQFVQWDLIASVEVEQVEDEFQTMNFVSNVGVCEGDDRDDQCDRVDAVGVRWDVRSDGGERWEVMEGVEWRVRGEKWWRVLSGEWEVRSDGGCWVESERW
jgi:hypothetical protein